MTLTRTDDFRRNQLKDEDRAAHDWFRFVLSFPPHLVRTYLERFEAKSTQIVLDPFCGTGTTLVECKKFGFPSVGIEANPAVCFASKVKTDWSVDPVGLRENARAVAHKTTKHLESEGIAGGNGLPLFAGDISGLPILRELSVDSQELLLAESISPLPLHKVLVLLEYLQEYSEEEFLDHQRLALANVLVFQASNLHFGPEVGVRRTKRTDAPVVQAWLSAVEQMAQDIEVLRKHGRTKATVYLGDAREPQRILNKKRIDAVITSPPYPNEKDYTRTTRLESVILGFLSSKDDIRGLKKTLVRSNTRGVYKADEDDQYVKHHSEINAIADAIEKRRIELGKTSGFERLYPRVTKLYFGGMARHFSEMRSVLRPGAQLAYVVGDQASYLQVKIETGRLLADIAQSLGYVVRGLDLFRTRIATATKEQLREEVLLLQWPG